MNPVDQIRFPAIQATLNNGRTLILRLLRDEDGPALADFYEQIPPSDQFFYYPHPLTRANAMLNAGKASSPTEVVLVLDDGAGHIGGYAWFRWRAGESRSGFGICLLSEFKGSGAGQWLMERLMQIAREIGPPVMCLTVQKANLRAVTLYRKMGFIIVRDQLRARDQEPEYYMECAVRSPR